MQSIQQHLKNKLSNLYDEIGTELNFKLSLRDLVAKREVWQTDIVYYLRLALRNLLTADVCELPPAEKIDKQLQAELMIRHLIESLNSELTEFHSQSRPKRSTRSAQRHNYGQKNNHTTLRSDAEWHNYFTEGQPEQFFRTGNQVDVMVDQLSETNFFADISDDLQSGGLFVATYDVLSVGKNLSVRLVIPGSGLFRLEGTVSWVREADNCADEDISPGMGISFNRLTPEPMRAIEQFMSQRQPLLFEMH